MNINKLIRTVRKAKANTEEVLTLQLLTEIEVELEEESNLVEAPVGMPSENSFGQWISVKDKFPDEDIPVLVRVKKPLGEVGRYTVNRWTSYTDQNKEWFNKHFSHWMPLPKP